MVSIPSLGIACRSTAELADELCSRGLPLSAPLPTFTSCAQPPHELGEAPAPPFAPLPGQRWPAVGSSAAAPPCAPSSPVPSSSCAFSWCTVFASSRVSYWWCPHRRLARRRRELAGQRRPCLGLTDRWGAVDRGGPLVSALDRIWVHSTGCTQYFVV